MKELPATPAVTLKPGRAGLLVSYPGPGRRYLPAEGAPIRLNTYWRARLRCGDAVEVKPAAPRKTSSKD